MSRNYCSSLARAVDSLRSLIANTAEFQRWRGMPAEWAVAHVHVDETQFAVTSQPRPYALILPAEYAIRGQQPGVGRLFGAGALHVVFAGDAEYPQQPTASAVAFIEHTAQIAEQCAQLIANGRANWWTFTDIELAGDLKRTPFGERSGDDVWEVSYSFSWDAA